MNKKTETTFFSFDDSLTKKEKILRYSSPLKAIIYFSIPTVFIMLVASLYNLADKLMAQLFAAPNLLNNKQFFEWYKQIIGGKLPEYNQQINDMKGYINIATQYSYVVFNIGSAFASTIAIGSSILYSIEYGKRNYRRMGIIFNNSIVFSLIITITGAILLWFLSDPNFGCLLIKIQEGDKSNPIVTQLSWNYTKYFLLMMPLFCLNFIFLTTLRSQGKMLTLILVNISSLLLNCVLDFIIIKYGGLNLDGAMLATGVSWVYNIIAIILVISKEKDQHLKFSWQNFKFLDLKILKSSSSLGLTAFFIKISNAAISIITAYFITHLHGTSLVDKKQTFILQQLTASIMPWLLLLLNITSGISQGARVIISYSYGAKKTQRIKKLTWNIFWILLVWISLFDLMTLLFGPYMTMAFSFPPEYAFKYRWYTFCFIYSYPFFSFTFTVITLFNSIKKPFMSALISLLHSAIIFMILSLIGFEISNYVYDNISNKNPGLIYLIFIGSNEFITFLVTLPITLLYYIKFREKTKHEKFLNSLEEDINITSNNNIDSNKNNLKSDMIIEKDYINDKNTNFKDNTLIIKDIDLEKDIDDN